MYVTEIKRDLFSSEEKYALAHCVAKDFKMGAGIAVAFSKKYEHGRYLRQLDAKVGDTIICRTNTGREIAYMVTKEISSRLPNPSNAYDDMRQALLNLFNNVQSKYIAMPRIGCGLERLDWKKVKRMVEELCPKDVTIVIYYL